ncbi:MAG: pyrroline-5-carboxylate reductase dimerization domain-containing protein [Lentilactobacillus hilgardii]|uniref:pyrroline-5-carboxylate reductase family protein n=1 Tax=Lentilactobacillus hilgardii TaxID=1588 RepID=UPI001CC21BB5|nr:pyrroline-5-carboxylate reductase dimerization domain-containing protein [Lentilactobacillus hilgardii]MBZ2202151.1 pyrroline-5-carboxylate reductase [Lentilactobacillus hilgardii]MBZ2205141.1 pyrroline-5-carboxylate reductase [Lentilactobacillus hilgardii]
MTISLYLFGGGQMIEAIIRASLKNKAIKKADTFITDISEQRVKYLKERYGVNAETSINDFLKDSAIVLLGIRPQDDWSGLIKTIAERNPSTQVISIIAGVTIDQLQKAAGKELAITRIIPNTLTDTGFGYSGATLSRKSDKIIIDPFLSSFGKVDYIPEEQIDIYTGYGVAGPNYVYNFFIALTNAGVLGGLSRKQANAVALENLQGAAKMLEITGKHPYELLDINNSAGGVGIAAQHELDASDFAAGVQNAVLAAIQRTTDLGKDD